jgi:hypothetical protein
MNSIMVKNYGWFLYASIFLTGLLFLGQTPVVNNDEYWIGDAALNIAKGTGTNVTCYPELYLSIKANKTIGFSLLQSIPVRILGYNLFSLRLVSYISIFLAGYVFFRLSSRNGFSNWIGLPFLFVFNPYVWHIGHVGRPEAVLLLLAMFAAHCVFNRDVSKTYIIVCSLITFIAFFIYILGIYIGVFIAIILLLRIFKKEIKPSLFVLYSLSTAALTGLFVIFQGANNLFITYTGHEMQAGNLFGSFSSAFSFYGSALLTNKMAYSTWVLLLIALGLLIRKVSLGKLNAASVNIGLIYLLLSLAFFIYLRRTNMYYVVLIIAGLHLLAISLLRNVEKSKWLMFLVLGMNTVFVVFYSAIYPPREVMTVSENLKTRRIMAPIQYRGQLLDCNFFVAMEDYKGVLKTRQMAFGDYVKTHRIEYLLFDEFTEKQWYGAEVLKLAESNGELIDSGTMGSLGSRDYEDIPYFLSLRKAFSLMKERPRYRWKLYSINNQAKPFVSKP